MTLLSFSRDAGFNRFKQPADLHECVSQAKALNIF